MNDLAMRALTARCARSLRYALGLTREQLAERPGLSLTKVKGVETSAKTATLDHADCLARGLGVPVCDLLRE